MKRRRNITLPHKMMIIFCSLVLILMFMSLIARLYYIQVVQHKKFYKIKEKQYILTRNIAPKRGAIYDRNGKELAISIDVPSIGVHPCEVKEKYKDISDISRKLSAVLGMEESELMNKLNTKSSFVWIKRRVTDEVAEEIKKLDIYGITFPKEAKRYYPNGKLANQVIGFVGDNKGRSGIELKFDKYIKGETDLFVGRRDAFGRSILKDDKLYADPPRGNDVFLTIDGFIQYIAERELQKTALKYNAKAGTIIVQNPSTGEILALANWPTFNMLSVPDVKLPKEDVSLINCSAVKDMYEPGSTFKIITAAAVLEEKVAQVDEKFFCENGRYILAGCPIRDHEKEGWLTFQEIIEKSSNIGVAKVSEKLGKKKLFSYARDFGFGSLTGIQLPGEAKGILRHPKKWSKISLSRIGFGQEISVTPIQMISAVSAVANKGLSMEPYIIQSINDKNGCVIKKFKPKAKKRVIREETAKLLTGILKGVVERGTGQLAAVDGFNVAGKTGTAQKYDPELGSYSADKYVSSFVGYLPADDPKVTILVVIDEPEEIHWGSTVCAPAFASVAKEIMRYLNIPPESDILMAREVGR